MNKPYIICHMLTGVDGRLHPSRFTKSPDGDRSDWSRVSGQLYEELAGDAWLVGRVTMVEMAKGQPHAPSTAVKVERPHHFVKRGGTKYAVTIDTRGTVHFAKGDVGGDHPVVILGPDVPDSHLAELAADGISYVVADKAPIDLAGAMDILYRELGIKRLLLEGGAAINNGFLAAGLVDEVSVVIVPGIDGGRESESIIEGDEKLAGKIELSFKACKPLANGLVHLTYAVKPSARSSAA